MEERYCQCCGMPMGDTKEYMERKRTDQGLWTIVNTVMNMVHLHQIVQWRQ